MRPISSACFAPQPDSCRCNRPIREGGAIFVTQYIGKAPHRPTGSDCIGAPHADARSQALTAQIPSSATNMPAQPCDSRRRTATAFQALPPPRPGSSALGPSLSSHAGEPAGHDSCPHTRPVASKISRRESPSRRSRRPPCRNGKKTHWRDAPATAPRPRSGE